MIADEVVKYFPEIIKPGTGLTFVCSMHLRHLLHMLMQLSSVCTVQDFQLLETQKLYPL